MAKFYGNWNVHPKLDKPPVDATLRNISNILSDPKEQDINDKINKELSLKDLRMDFLTILTKDNIDPVIFDSFSTWKAFLQVFFKESLLGKPLKWIGVNGFARYTTEFALRTLSPQEFAGLDQHYVSEFGIQQSTFFWEAKIMPKNYTLSGPLVLTEKSEDFSRP